MREGRGGWKERKAPTHLIEISKIIAEAVIQWDICTVDPRSRASTISSSASVPFSYNERKCLLLSFGSVYRKHVFACTQGDLQGA